MLKGIAFDLDGIITDTAHFHFIAWKKIAQNLGFDIDEAFNENLKGVSREESLRRVLKHGGVEVKISKERFEMLLDEKNSYYLSLIENITPKDLLPGIADFLEACHQEEIGMVIASASKNAPAIIEKLGVGHYFQGIVDPSSLKRNKPDPEIFLKSAQILSLDPQDMIGIEDAEAGVTAINEAGMFSLGIGDYASLKHADFYLASTDLLDLEELKKKV